MTALSDHLFWDVDRSSIDPQRHAAWLVKRVLEYGRWRDWQVLVAHYGKPELAGLVTGLRSLQPRAFAFCRAWFRLPPSSFRCSASMPSRKTEPLQVLGESAESTAHLDLARSVRVSLPNLKRRCKQECLHHMPTTT